MNTDRTWTVTKSDHPVQNPFPADKATDDLIYTRFGKFTSDEAIKVFADYCTSIDTGCVQIWNWESEAGRLYI